MFSIKRTNDESVAQRSIVNRSWVVASFDEIAEVKDKYVNRLPLLHSAMEAPTLADFICKANEKVREDCSCLGTHAI